MHLKDNPPHKHFISKVTDHSISHSIQYFMFSLVFGSKILAEVAFA